MARLNVVQTIRKFEKELQTKMDAMVEKATADLKAELDRVTGERDEALKHLAIMVDANVCIVDPACGGCYVCNARSARARLADAPQEDPEHG